jgi:hypothetical protein
MRIHVGVIGNHPGWLLLLQQEGIPFSVDVNEIAIDGFSVVIAGDDTPSGIGLQLLEYLKQGGSVLCSGKTFQQFAGIKMNEKFIQYLVPNSNPEFANIDLVDIYRRCLMHPEANTIQSDDGKPSTFVGEYGGGYVIVLPFDAGEAILDYRTATKSFYAESSRLPFENVSLVSKGAILRLVSRALEILHHRRNLPYVHFWYYPKDARSIFAFRIDTDLADRSKIKSLYETLKSIGGGSRDKHITATWFVDVKSQKRWLADYANMLDQEIGIHCYEHKKFGSLEKFRDDVRQAIGVMSQVGLHPTCSAAPYGQWNEEIGEATESFGFQYTSEFSYDYDNLPSFPYLRSKFSNVLQLPIHPISIGNLRRQGFDKQDILKYYESLLKRKLAANEPCFIYHHPKNGYEEVLKNIFEFVCQNNISIVRMKEYVEWWKKRIEVKAQFEYAGSTLRVNRDSSEESIWVHIKQNNGLETLIPMSSEISFHNLKWTSKPSSISVSQDYLRIRKFNPWIWIIRSEDFVFNKLFRFLDR